MSLKAFHIIFITVSTILCFGVAAWAFDQWRMFGGVGNIVFALGSVVSGVALLAYGRYFLKKLKGVGYL